MANIAISEIATEATSLNDNDLLLISKNNGTSFTSAKMKASVLKGSGGTCGFSSDAVKTACETAITNKNVATTSNVQTAVETAIVTKNVATTTNLETVISESFSRNTTINETIAINSTRSNFIDWSQAMDINTKLSCQSLPFDAIVCWSTNPTKIEIDGIEVQTMLSGFKQCYIENGHEVVIQPYSSTTCWIVPLSYGTSTLQYNTNNITDWVSDGAGRSLIDEYFDSIEIRGGASTAIASNTQYGTMSAISGISNMYWTIKCQPKVNMIIGSGGKKAANTLYNYKYYVSGTYLHATSFNTSATTITNSGKKVLAKKNSYITMNFYALTASTTTKTTALAAFFDNIKWTPLTDFNIT